MSLFKDKLALLGGKNVFKDKFLCRSFVGCEPV